MGRIITGFQEAKYFARYPDYELPTYSVMKGRKMPNANNACSSACRFEYVFATLSIFKFCSTSNISMTENSRRYKFMLKMDEQKGDVREKINYRDALYEKKTFAFVFKQKMRVDNSFYYKTDK